MPINLTAPSTTNLNTSLSISREKVVELAKRLESSQKKLATIQGKGEKHAGEVIETGEYLGAMLALGYIRGRYGSFDFKGIPAEVLVGLAAHAVGFSGFLGKHSGDIHNIGNASLGFALAFEAIQLGKKAAEKEDKTDSFIDKAKAVVEEAAAVSQEIDRQNRPMPLNGLPPRSPTMREVVDLPVPTKEPSIP